MAAAKKTATSKNNPLHKLLGQYAEKHKVDQSSDLASLDLMDFLVTASPHLQKPEHLSPVLPYFYACERKPQIFAFSAPPRHGKSILTNHFVAWMMIRHPGIRVAYGCYGEKLAFFFSDEVKDILTANGYKVDRTRNSRNEWRLENGSLFKAVSPGSDFTGRGADLIIIDDPYKNRVTASSGAVRQSTWDWFTSVAITRRSPNCSVIVTHTRWHPEDIIGVLTNPEKMGKREYKFINMPAINEDNEILWPSMWPRERLEEIRAINGEYDWYSLYQGSPQPKGGALFKDYESYSPEEYKARLENYELVKYTIGIDLAYTKKAQADYSVAVVLAEFKDGSCYVVDMRREQCEAREFAKHLAELRMLYDGASVYWYTGGQEKVVAEMFRINLGIPVKDMPAQTGGDKFARAQSVAAAWNNGKVLLPSGPDGGKPPLWMTPFIAEISAFTGNDDPHDDIVDALAAAYAPMAKKRIARINLDRPVLPW